MATKENLARSRSKTINKLYKVVDTIGKSGEKLTITSVTRAANVTPALIHNTYPEVADKIRALAGRSMRSQNESRYQALIEERGKNKALRAENRQLLEELSRIASINQRLLLEMAELRARSNGKVKSLTVTPRN